MNIRLASIKDLDFIHSEIIAGAQNGHYRQDFYKNPQANIGLKYNLQSILLSNKRLDGQGHTTYGLILEENSISVSFALISAIDKDLGTELWMLSTTKKYQNLGYASKFIELIIQEFKTKKNGTGFLLARCSPSSDIMYKILKKKGFVHTITGPEEGTRYLELKF